MTSLHRDPKLRASDADRDHVAELLREHTATGRLTMAEFQDRLDRCYTAQTYGDLEGLVDDLPPADPYADLPVPVTAGHHVPVPTTDDADHEGWAAWASVSAICWAIWLATVATGGGIAGLWPVWVMVPWAGVLVAQAMSNGSGRPALPRAAQRRELPPGVSSRPRRRAGRARRRSGR